MEWITSQVKRKELEWKKRHSLCRNLGSVWNSLYMRIVNKKYPLMCSCQKIRNLCPWFGFEIIETIMADREMCWLTMCDTFLLKRKAVRQQWYWFLYLSIGFENYGTVTVRRCFGWWASHVWTWADIFPRGSNMVAERLVSRGAEQMCLSTLLLAASSRLMGRYFILRLMHQFLLETNWYKWGLDPLVEYLCQSEMEFATHVIKKLSFFFECLSSYDRT